MRTLFIARALLLMADPDTAGGIPAEPNPNTNDAGAAPSPEIATAGSDQAGNGGLQQGGQVSDEIQAIIDKNREEAARIRELTPAQEFELRPCAGAAHLGVIVLGEGGYRCIPLADWRTDRLVLRAGDEARIVVLAGEGQKQWDYCTEAERRAKEQPPLGAVVKTVSLDPAAAAAVLGAQAANLQPASADSAGAAPAVDPLEQTQDTELPTGTGQPNSSATPDPATGP